MASDWKKMADGKEKYAAYLQSPEWGEKRRLVRARSNGRCERCYVNTQDATHHLTYVRKYDENLEDLIAICRECHEHSHGHSEGNVRRLSLNIYLAGKVGKNCWRHQIVYGLRDRQFNEYPDSPLNQSIRVMSESRVTYFANYTGPFFISCDHGCGHSSGTVHGCGPNVCVGGLDVHGGNHETKAAVFNNCEEQIRKSDIFIAWIDDETAYGTLVEIGMAHAMGKPIYVGAKASVSGLIMKNLWFAFQASRDLYEDHETPKEFVNSAIMHFVENDL